MNNIIQYWDSELPLESGTIIETWKTLNPQSTYKCFDKQSAGEFLHTHYGPNVSNAFLSLTLPAMQSHIFRVAYILSQGGVFASVSIKCLRAIVEWNIKASALTLMRKHNGNIWNGLLIAPAGHSALRAIWEELRTNLINRKEGEVWTLTGSGVFTSHLGNAAPQTNISLIDQAKLADRIQIINSLAHKESSHWSLKQRITPLFTPVEPLPVPNKYQQKLKSKMLIIHLGLHKTATTSIQQQLAKRQNADFYYPQTGKLYSGHHQMVKLLGVPNEKIVTETLNAFWEECAKCNEKRVIMSSEFLSSSNEISFNKITMNRLWRNLSRLSSAFGNVKLVLYIREQAESLESRINQAIKSRICLSDVNLRELVKNPTLNYLLLCDHLTTLFPHAKLAVHDYGSLRSSGIVPHFFDCYANQTVGNHQSNQQIDSMWAVLLSLLINKTSETTDNKMALKAKCASINGTPDDFDAKRILSQSNVEFIRDYFSAKNKQFFKRYALHSLHSSYSSFESNNLFEKVRTYEKIGLHQLSEKLNS